MRWIPPPRFHMLRYHSVLAGHSKDRAEVVPQPDDDDEATDPQLCLFEPGDDPAVEAAVTTVASSGC